MSYSSFNVNEGVLKHHSLSGLTRAIIMSTAAVIALLGVYASQASAATETVVTPGSGNGWVETEFGTGSIDYVTSAGAPLGTGAVQFTTPDDTSYTRLRHDMDAPLLSSITTLSYQTKRVAPVGDDATAAVNLRLYVDTDNSGTFDDVLVYEPYYNGDVTMEWQTWNITQTSGKWWSNNGPLAGSYATNFTLAEYLVQYPNAKIDEIGLGTGNFNSPWTVQADALTINSTVYNFEVSNSTSTKPMDACKNGGHVALNYKNQGQCIAGVQSNTNSTSSILHPRYKTNVFDRLNKLLTVIMHNSGSGYEWLLPEGAH